MNFLKIKTSFCFSIDLVSFFFHFFSSKRPVRSFFLERYRDYQRPAGHSRQALCSQHTATIKHNPSDPTSTKKIVSQPLLPIKAGDSAFPPTLLSELLSKKSISSLLFA
jgi:hypothetical protein